MKIFGNYFAATQIEEQEMFFSLLYHDYRQGQIIRMRINGAEVKQYSTCDIEDLACTGTDGNYYISINTFRGSRRTADNVYNRTAMYIDLDCHNYATEDELEKVKKRTESVLEEAWKSGVLSVPTMITSTGRGYGIYYVLQQSIAGTDAARKSTQLFERTYGQLMEKYKSILSMFEDGDRLLSVDTKVRDATRVARIPGSVNLSNGKMCHLVSVNYTDEGGPLYYNLRGLINGSKLCSKAEKKSTVAKVISYNAYVNPFLSMRVERMKALQALRGAACVNECREIMCFIVYSSLVQIYDHDRAVDLLYAYSRDFTIPLPEEELEHIIAETDEHIVPKGIYKGCKGYYPYSDHTIIRTLDITDEEIAKIGFGKGWQRQRRKEENRRKREERNRAIAVEVKDDPQKTYQEIAETYGVSVKTVERIAKIYGVNRYHKEDALKAEKIAEGQVSTVGEQKGPSVVLPVSDTGETDKKCTESFGVRVLGGYPQVVQDSCYASVLDCLLATAYDLGRIAPGFWLFVRAYVQSQLSVYGYGDYVKVLDHVAKITTEVALWICDYRYGRWQFIKKKETDSV